MSLGCIAIRLAVAVALVSSLAGCLRGSRQFELWVVDERAGVDGESPPSFENQRYSRGDARVRLDAAINETVAFQVCLRTARPPSVPLIVRVGALRGAAGVIAADQVRLFRARYLRVARFPVWYSEHTGKPAVPTFVPDVLVPWDTAGPAPEPLRLDGARNAIVWVDVTVPPTASPGVYAGSLEVREAGSDALLSEQTVELRVQPVVLPARPALPVLCRVDPRALARTTGRWASSEGQSVRLVPGLSGHRRAIQLTQAAMKLFHSHGTSPFLWGSFPEFRPVGNRRVEVDWEPFDTLVGGWIDGSAYEDRAPPHAWPLPISTDHPGTRAFGSFDRPGYARAFAAYYDACVAHFRDRGWLDRAFVAPFEHRELSGATVAAVERVSAILQQAAEPVPLGAFLPPSSPRALGWVTAPQLDDVHPDYWLSDATTLQPKTAAQQQLLGAATWMLPTQPPYSGSLELATRADDPLVLGWIAYRYGLDGLWVDAAAEVDPRDPQGADGLIHVGGDAAVLPSMRLKRLRRGIQDHMLLTLLRESGRARLAQQLSEQLVPYALTDACVENLLATRAASWPRDPSVYELAHAVLLQELANTFAPTAGERAQIDNLASWGQLMTRVRGLELEPRGVRVRAGSEGLVANVSVAANNAGRTSIQGRWRLDAAPVGWDVPALPTVDVPRGTRRESAFDIELRAVAYNVDGVYPFQLHLDRDVAGVSPTTAGVLSARLAIAAAPFVRNPPAVDGDLRDWLLATNNAAGDFQLVRWSADRADRRPTRETRAYACMTDDELFFAVRCALRRGERPIWNNDNQIAVVGAQPWGEDVVEILLDPLGRDEGTSSDLYCLQIKPNGTLVARRGCRTDPPMGASEIWNCGARVATEIRSDAWFVEIAVPLRAFGPDADTSRVWSVNFTRLDKRHGEYASWSGARRTCYTPRSLGNLVLQRP